MQLSNKEIKKFHPFLQMEANDGKYYLVDRYNMPYMYIFLAFRSLFKVKVYEMKSDELIDFEEMKKKYDSDQGKFGYL